MKYSDERSRLLVRLRYAKCERCPRPADLHLLVNQEKGEVVQTWFMDEWEAENEDFE